MGEQLDVRRSPTGRVPLWVLQEARAAEHPAVGSGEPWFAADLLPHPAVRARADRRRSGRHRAARRLLAGAVTLALVVGGGWLAGAGHLDGVASAAVRLQRGAATGGPPAPTPGFEEAAAPLGAPPPAVVTSDRYVLRAPQPRAGGGFLARRAAAEQAVVAYDPCRPVHYVVRTAGAPPGATRILAEAVGRVAAATGLVFVDDGPTAEGPSAERVLFQPEAYGDRWAPVLVSWATAEEVPALVGDVAGLGGSASVVVPGQPEVLVTGAVTLDGPQLGALLQQPGGEDLVRSIVMHELAHLVGLEHVDDPAQLMHPTTRPGLTEFAAGDLAGLAAVGRGSCAPLV